MSRPVLAHGALAALLSLLLAMPQGLLVLCAGGDGHLALELAPACANPAPGPERVFPSLEQDRGCVDDCGPCRDTHLGSALHGARPARDRDVRADDVAFTISLPAPIQLAATSPAAPDFHSPPVSVPRAPARSMIVLRI